MYSMYDIDHESDADCADFDDEEPFFDDEECAGHYDDDFALNSGAGIGEPVYCDGSCM